VSVVAERKPRLLMVELNEVDPEFLRAASAQLSLRNIPRVLALQHSRTTTPDLVEGQGLDPWTQWVSIHTGVPSDVHGVLRLGVTRSQQHPQLWHALAARGKTWGVWGAMNAPLGDPAGCAFFMPDPWSYDEVAYPAPLNDVLALPRYVSKNYLEISRREIVRGAARLVRFFAHPSHWRTAARFGAAALKSVLRTGPNVHTFTTLLDYLSVLAFVELRGRTRPDFSLIFLNHIAHLQHQFWLAEGKLHPEMELGLRLCDAMVGTLLDDRCADEALLVMNAFKQTNVAGQGFFSYRQRNPVDALAALGITGGRVEQCMVNDAHVLFDDSAQADEAEAVLRATRLSDGATAFYVERRDATSLFYKLNFEHRVAADARLLVGDRSLPFGDVFELVCERTGAHVPEGDVYADAIGVAPELRNHDVYAAVLAHFGEPSLSQPAANARAQSRSEFATT
jgi:hypothetical protein